MSDDYDWEGLEREMLPTNPTRGQETVMRKSQERGYTNSQTLMLLAMVDLILYEARLDLEYPDV